MKSLKISQIQFQARSTPNDNCIQLEKFYKKTLTFNPDLICTPECSNIITNDKKHLFNHSTFQNECPIINMAKSSYKQMMKMLSIKKLQKKVRFLTKPKNLYKVLILLATLGILACVRKKFLVKGTISPPAVSNIK